MTIETELDEAARRCAVRLMRLCQSLDAADAMEYRAPARWERLAGVRTYYRRWFRRVVEPRSVDRGEVATRRGSAHRRVP